MFGEPNHSNDSLRPLKMSNLIFFYPWKAIQSIDVLYVLPNTYYLLLYTLLSETKYMQYLIRKCNFKFILNNLERVHECIILTWRYKRIEGKQKICDRLKQSLQFYSVYMHHPHFWPM